MFILCYIRESEKKALDKKQKSKIEQLKQLCITKNIMVFTDMQLLLIDVYRSEHIMSYLTSYNTCTHSR